MAAALWYRARPFRTSTFQIADGDAQNIRVGSFVFNGSTFEYIAYGDATATQIVEFDSSGNQIASITDATTVVFNQIENFGDGRIGILYDEPDGPNGTTQYDTKVYDLRSTGLNINDSNLSDGLDKFVAGTQFNDVFTGESNVTNTYYFVGENTTLVMGRPTYSMAAISP